MDLMHMNIKTRLTLFISIVSVLSLLMFISSYNQVKNLNEMHKISKLTEEFVFFEQRLDSAERRFLKNLSEDSRFFKSGKNDDTRNIKMLIEDVTDNVFYLSHNYYINKDSALSGSFSNTIILLEQINAAYEQYFILLTEKGNSKYGKIGKLFILFDDLDKLIKNQSFALNQQLVRLKELYFKYQENPDPIIFNQINVIADDMEATAINSYLSQKLVLVRKIQSIKQLFNEIYRLDNTIGFTNTDGLKGKALGIKNNWMVEANIMSNLIEEQIYQRSVRAYIIISIFFVLFIFSLALLYWQFYNFILSPISRIQSFIIELVKGKLPEPLTIKGKDEINEMSSQLNNFVESLRVKADFAIQIGQGKHDIIYQPLGEEDILGNALLDMNKSLLKAEMEDQKYKDEEKKRIWANEGLALFSEILRQNNSDIKILSDEIIRNLVKYVNAILGGIFYLNEDKNPGTYLELASAFAFDRKKHVESKINLGEGLVGTCAIEAETIFITDVPDNYVFITSGLGDSKPNSILLVPLKLENEVLGVIELASFHIFQPDEIDFVEKISQSISSTITTVRINARTSVLLEQSQRQAQEMAEQEEEMRQNMEELRTTQEDFSRRESELTSTIKALNESANLLTFDMFGVVTDVNSKILKTLNAKPEDIINKNYHELSATIKHDEIVKAWNDLSAGYLYTTIDRFRLQTGKDIWFELIFTPILNHNSIPYKVICLANNISEIKHCEQRVIEKDNEISKLNQSIIAIKSQLDNAMFRAEFKPDGKYISTNEKYCQSLGYKTEELVNKDVFFRLKDDERQQMEKIWGEVNNDKQYTGNIKRTKPTGEELWMIASFTPGKDHDGKITSILMTGFDITEKKLKYQLLEEANKEIERLRNKG